MIRELFNMLNKVKISLLFVLLITYYSQGISANTVNIKILTTEIGIENESYPSDIIELWKPLIVSGKEITPLFELIRIDQSPEITLPFSVPIQDKIIPPDPEVKLDREIEEFKEKKIDTNFSTNKPSNFNLAKKYLAKLNNQDNIFYLKSYIENKIIYDNSVDLLKAIEININKNTGKDQNYFIVYKVIDIEALDRKKANSAAIKKLIEEAKASKDAAENDAAIAITAANSAKKSATEAQSYKVPNPGNCKEAINSAGKIVASTQSFIQATDKAKEEAIKAANKAKENSLAANKYLQQALQNETDKQIVESATKIAASEAASAANNKKIAEEAKASAIKNADNAKKESSTLLATCQPTPVPHSTPSQQANPKKPNPKHIHHNSIENPNDENSIDPNAAKKNTIHQDQEKIRQNFLQ